MPYFLINDTTTEQTLSILIKTCKMLINTWLSEEKNDNAHCTLSLEISLFVRLGFFVCVCLVVWLFVCLGFFVPLENFSFIWRHHHCRWSAANFDLGTALMAIEQWGFLSVPHQLLHGASVYYGHHLCHGWDLITQPSGEVNVLTDCAPLRWPKNYSYSNACTSSWCVQIFRQHNRYKLQLFIYVSEC